MFKKILVPLDGSETAEKVLPFVINIAQKNDAHIIIIRIIPPLRPALMSIPKVVERVDQEIEGIVKVYLDKITTMFRTQGLKVEAVIEKGKPSECILKFAKNTGCDLIVIGTFGYTRETSWRTGTVAMNIIRAEIDIPLLIIPT